MVFLDSWESGDELKPPHLIQPRLLLPKSTAAQSKPWELIFPVRAVTFFPIPNLKLPIPLLPIWENIPSHRKVGEHPRSSCGPFNHEQVLHAVFPDGNCCLFGLHPKFLSLGVVQKALPGGFDPVGLQVMEQKLHDHNVFSCTWNAKS